MEWRKINEFDYEVSNYGHVRSMDRQTLCSNGIIKTYKGKLMSPTISRQTGYLTIRASKNGVTKTLSIHRLVALAFIDRQNKNLHVNHKDGDKLNNKLSNLEWVTPSENNYHAHRNGLSRSPLGEDSGKSKFLNQEIIIIREAYANGFKMRPIARYFNVHHSTISNIVNNISWTHV